MVGSHAVQQNFSHLRNDNIVLTRGYLHHMVYMPMNSTGNSVLHRYFTYTHLFTETSALP